MFTGEVDQDLHRSVKPSFCFIPVTSSKAKLNIDKLSIHHIPVHPDQKAND